MSRNRCSRRAMSASDLFWWLLILALLISILLPSLSRARELAKREVCASHQRGIGQGLHIYAFDNARWFPHHYFEAAPAANAGAAEHGIRWVGTMGSTASLRISQATSPQLSPRSSHPSRSLFLLLIGGNATPGMFNCPSPADQVDDLRNYGPDADEEPSTPALPGQTRFDFRGYDFLSYGYQLPYGPRGRPHADGDPRMTLLADKGPYYQSGGPGLAGTKTVVDERAGLQPPVERNQLDYREFLDQNWAAYNSRNHRGEGQNALRLDGHVAFERTPLAGVNMDNIYTVQGSIDDQKQIMIGMAPAAEERIGPMRDTDSFIVP